MHRIGVFLLLIVSLFSSSCFEYTDADVAADMERLQGKWELKRVVSFNQDNSSPSSITLSFDEEVVIYQEPGYTFTGLFSVSPNSFFFDAVGSFEILKVNEEELTVINKENNQTQFYEKVN